MTDLLNKVNPGLKSRVSDVIDFPDFNADAAAELAGLQLAERRLKLPGGRPADALISWTERLAAAPQWANGRDVETFVRRVAVECATRKTSEVTIDALDAALANVLKMKGLSAPPATSDFARSPPVDSPFATAEPATQFVPNFDIKSAMEVALDETDEDEDDGADDAIDFGDALEEAIVALGYDKDLASRRKLERMLQDAVDGLAPFPDILRSRVLSQTGAPPEEVDAALKRRAKPVLVAVKQAIEYQVDALNRLEEDGDDDEDALDEAFIMERLRTMGPCPAGFSWFRSGNGWRCGGGSHFVYDDDPILKPD